MQTLGLGPLFRWYSSGGDWPFFLNAYWILVTLSCDRGQILSGARPSFLFENPIRVAKGPSSFSQVVVFAPEQPLYHHGQWFICAYRMANDATTMGERNEETICFPIVVTHYRHASRRAAQAVAEVRSSSRKPSRCAR